MSKLPFAFRLLRTFCPDHLYEEIEGDLIQKFNRDKQRFTIGKAKRKLYWNIIRFFRPGIILRNKLPQQIISTIMIQNYFVVAWRSFLKRKVLSSINIIGLSFGIAFALLAFLFVHDELSFDQGHKNSDLIYRVDVLPVHNETPQVDERSTSVPSALHSTIRQEISGVDYVTRYNGYNKTLILGEEKYTEKVHYVDQDFLSMFTLEFIAGDFKSALSSINTMIISDEKALKLFGTVDVIGKTIETKQGLFTITGVFKALPKNSTFNWHIIIRYENYYGKDAQPDSWNSSYGSLFIQRKPDFSAEALKSALRKTADTHVPPFKYEQYTKRTEFALMPLPELHFDTKSNWTNTSNKASSYVLASIAVMVLLVACLNYVLLSLAGSASRTREIGVRKVIGATRKMIRFQFLSESIVIILISVPVSLLLLYVILPEFNDFMGRSLTLTGSGNKWIAALAFIILFTGILAGGYPAAALSHMVPQKILKSNTSGNYKARFSGLLIVFQFTACLVMLICAVIMYSQMKMIQTRDLGFNKEQVIAISTKNDRAVPPEKIISNFRNELASEPNVIMISALAFDFGDIGGISSKVNSEGKQTFEYYTWVDYDFFELLDIKLVEGRFFSRSHADTIRRRFVVNRAFADQLKLESGAASAIGKMPNRPDDEIVGVVENFNFESLENEVKPIAFELGGKNGDQLLVKVSPADLPGTITKLEQTWKKVVGDNKFAFTFFDDFINNQYKRYTQWIRLVTISTCLAIGIACLGLLGIISLAVINRTKEIGIRKVLGASTMAILTLFSKYYLQLIVVAFVLAAPAAFYLSSQWMHDFAYKIDITWVHFVYPLVGLIALALVIVGSQVAKTIRINPADTLKSE
ncbi:MAG: ABC transporter permease [Cyclobacteriaceae bacterium]|nr:ABC transporter permease [Cyclobacteriaceae bacterium]